MKYKLSKGKGRLNVTQARFIKYYGEQWNPRFTNAEIAELFEDRYGFSISEKTVYDIRQGRSWPGLNNEFIGAPTCHN